MSARHARPALWAAAGAAVLCSIALVAPANAQDLAINRAKVDSAEIDYVRVSLQKFDLRVLAASVPSLQGEIVQASAPVNSATGLFLQDYLSRYGAAAALSGGYLVSYSPPSPLGLLRSNRIQVSDVHQSWLLDGLLCSNPGHAEITLVSDDPVRADFRDCVQAGLVLLLNKKTLDRGRTEQLAKYNKLMNSPLEHTFVCLKDNNEAIVGVSAKVELAKLIAALQGPEFGCISAIRFASGGLRLRSVDKVFGTDDVLLPSAIGVIPAAQ